MARGRLHSVPYMYYGFSLMNFCSEDLQAKEKGGENIQREGGEPHLQKTNRRDILWIIMWERAKNIQARVNNNIRYFMKHLSKGDTDQKHCQTSSKFLIYHFKSQAILNNNFF